MALINSLGSGVSGLQSFQTKMDVIGNNIANVNTTGFKSRSVAFAEMLNQNLNRSGQNSETATKRYNQVGLGVQVASINQDMSQGSLEASNRPTDLALDGDGFFMVNDGSQDLLTRAGNFSFNKNGQLVTSQGHLVQGFNANSAGDIVAGGSAQNIQVDFDEIFAPQKTQNVNLAGNLDAHTSETQVVSSLQAFTTNSGELATGSTELNDLDQTLDSFSAGDAIDFSVTDHDGNTSTQTFTYGSANDGTTLGDFVSSVDSAFGGSANVELADGLLKMRSETPGDSQLNFQIDSIPTTSQAEAQEVTQDSAFTTGGGTAAVGTDDINTLDQTNTAFVAGDVLELSGTDTSGNDVNVSFTYGAGNDGTTLNDLLSSISSAFPDATASLDGSGNIVLTGDNAEDSQMTLNTLAEATGATGDITDQSFSITTQGNTSNKIDMPTFSTTNEGDTKSQTISTTVYDSLGEAHTLLVEFTQEDSGFWNYNSRFLDGEQINSGGTGNLQFHESGNLVSDGSAGIQFDPGNGANPMQFDLNFDNGVKTLTQYDGTTTANVSSQDGFAKGELIDFFIDSEGVIQGDFSNGKSKNLAQIAVSNVSNPEGLNNEGNGLYSMNTQAGTMQVNTAEALASTTVNSGFLEGSNVDLNEQFTDMIVTQRAFQSNARVITTSDQLLAETVQLKR